MSQLPPQSGHVLQNGPDGAEGAHGEGTPITDPQSSAQMDQVSQPMEQISTHDADGARVADGAGMPIPQEQQKISHNIQEQMLKSVVTMKETLVYMEARTVQCSTHALYHTCSAVKHTCNATAHVRRSAVQHSAMQHKRIAAHIQCNTHAVQHLAVQCSTLPSRMDFTGGSSADLCRHVAFTFKIFNGEKDPGSRRWLARRTETCKHRQDISNIVNTMKLQSNTFKHIRAHSNTFKHIHTT